jgi:hypothetical protein
MQGPGREAVNQSFWATVAGQSQVPGWAGHRGAVFEIFYLYRLQARSRVKAYFHLRGAASEKTVCTQYAVEPVFYAKEFGWLPPTWS